MGEDLNNVELLEEENSSETSDETITDISEPETGNETAETGKTENDVSGNDTFETDSEDSEIFEENLNENETVIEVPAYDYHDDLSDIKNMFSILIFLLIGFFLGLAFIKGFNK